VAITLRQVRETDDSFLFELYASTRESELQQVPWNDAQKHSFLQMQFAAQKSSYAASHPQATHEIICRDGEAVGRLYLAALPERFHILDITIAPARRNEGIGSTILKRVMKQADQAGKPVTIYVETFNPSMHLFERLGFQSASVTGFHVLLQRPPAPLT